MRAILFGALAAIVALVGGTIYAVFSQAAVSHQAAIDRCHDAGGAWVANGARSYSGACLRAPQTPQRAAVTPPTTPAPAP